MLSRPSHSLEVAHDAEVDIGMHDCMARTTLMSAVVALPKKGRKSKHPHWEGRGVFRHGRAAEAGLRFRARGPQYARLRLHEDAPAIAGHERIA